MEQQINELRDQGFTLTAIATILNCSRSKVTYHIDPNVKLAAKMRTEITRAKAKKANMKAKAAIVIPTVVKKEKSKKIKTPARKNNGKKVTVDFKPAPKRKSIFKTKDMGLDEKVKVRLDHKTEVYVLPGYNIEKLRTKYLRK